MAHIASMFPKREPQDLRFPRPSCSTLSVLWLMFRKDYLPFKRVWEGIPSTSSFRLRPPDVAIVLCGFEAFRNASLVRFAGEGTWVLRAKYPHVHFSQNEHKAF